MGQHLHRLWRSILSTFSNRIANLSKFFEVFPFMSYDLLLRLIPLFVPKKAFLLLGIKPGLAAPKPLYHALDHSAGYYVTPSN